MTNEDIRKMMEDAQKDLQNALKELIEEIGDKLSSEERSQIKQEVDELNEILDRLKEGVVWIAVFGKTGAGKSSLINSLIGDDVAKVDVTHDTTTEISGYPADYKEGRWKLVDVPGIMGDQLYENMAIEEVKKAHGQIFVLDGEPFQDELEIFDIVKQHTPNVPRVIFVNKWDAVQLTMPIANHEKLKERIWEKMKSYVDSPEDIVYGSSRLLDVTHQEMIRQELPQLLNRLYESAGTLGMVINVLDPANRADNLTDAINAKIHRVRRKVSQRIIYTYGILSMFGTFVPFDTVLVAPPLHISMVSAVFNIIGAEDTSVDVRTAASKLVKDYYMNRYVETGLIGVVEGGLSIAAIFGLSFIALK